MNKKIICLLTILSLVFSFSTTNYAKAATENTLQSNSLLNEETIENAKEVLQTENLEKYLNQIESTGKLNAKIQMTLQTVEVAAKVYCNPSGSYYSEWY